MLCNPWRNRVYFSASDIFERSHSLQIFFSILSFVFHSALDVLILLLYLFTIFSLNPWACRWPEKGNICVFLRIRKLLRLGKDLKDNWVQPFDLFLNTGPISSLWCGRKRQTNQWHLAAPSKLYCMITPSMNEKNEKKMHVSHPMLLLCCPCRFCFIVSIYFSSHMEYIESLPPSKARLL